MSCHTQLRLKFAQRNLSFKIIFFGIKENRFLTGFQYKLPLRGVKGFQYLYELTFPFSIYL
jgi:hypothetical protein